MREKKGGMDMEIGEKIRRLRLQRGLTQEELADRCELSKGFISLLERDLTSPSIATLTDILECLGSDLPAFFSEQKDEKLVFTEEDTYVKEDEEELKGSIRWLVPTAQRNQMEPILVEMEAGGTTSEDDPHEGEEFVYVMEGAIEVCHGKNKYVIEAGDTIYYDSIVPHHFHGYQGQAAKILAVVYTPI